MRVAARVLTATHPEGFKPPAESPSLPSLLAEAATPRGAVSPKFDLAQGNGGKLEPVILPDFWLDAPWTRASICLICRKYIRHLITGKEVTCDELTGSFIPCRHNCSRNEKVALRAELYMKGKRVSEAGAVPIEGEFHHDSVRTL